MPQLDACVAEGVDHEQYEQPELEQQEDYNIDVSFHLFVSSYAYV